MSDELKEKIAGEIALSPEPGKAIRKWREEFGISQYELADAMGVSHSVISDYESGRRKSPGVGVVRKMVGAFLKIDDDNGSPVQNQYMPKRRLSCILAMDEFPQGVEEEDFVRAIAGTNINPGQIAKKRIYGYTIVDSLKAILTLSSQDYLQIYGWSIERAIIFTDVHYGRSPMVAIRAHPLTPAMVVYQNPDNTDPLAIKLAEREGVPLVTTTYSVEELVKHLTELKEGQSA
ncbi:helix-turn-helix domain-containing protein [Methanomassiliicoccaceae archaeon COG_1]|nr:helix-turn-helix domain-containing protein [Methanomassiliicoccaceae archaeon COG_1]